MSYQPIDERIKKYVSGRLTKIDQALSDYFAKMDNDKLFKITKAVGMRQKMTELDMNQREIETLNEKLKELRKELRDQEKFLTDVVQKKPNDSDAKWIAEQMKSIVSQKDGLNMIQQRIDAKLGLDNVENIPQNADVKVAAEKAVDISLAPSNYQEILQRTTTLDKITPYKMKDMTDDEFSLHKNAVLQLANDLETLINNAYEIHNPNEQQKSLITNLHAAAYKVDKLLSQVFAADKSRSYATQFAYFVAGAPRSLLKDSIPSLAFKLPPEVTTDSQKLAHYQGLAEHLRDNEGLLNRLQNVSEKDFISFKNKVMNLAAIVEQMIQTSKADSKALSPELIKLAKAVDQLTLNYDKADELRHPWNPVRRIPALIRGKPKLLEEHWLPSATQAVKNDIVAEQQKLENAWKQKMRDHFEPSDNVVTPTQRAMVKVQKSTAAWIHPPLMPWERTALDRKRQGYELVKARQKVYEDKGLVVQSGVEGMKRMLSGSAEVAEEFVSELALTQAQAAFLTLGGPALAAIILARGLISVPAYVFSLASAGVNGIDQGINEMITAVIGKHPLVKGEDGKYHYKLDTVGDYLKLGGRALAHGVLRSVTWPTKWALRGASAVFHAFDSGLSYLTKKPSVILPVLTIGGTAAGFIFGATVIASAFTFGLPLVALGVAAAAVAIGGVFLSWYRAREKAVELKNLALNPIDEARLLTSQYEPTDRIGPAQAAKAGPATAKDVAAVDADKDKVKKPGLLAKLISLVSKAVKADEGTKADRTEDVKRGQDHPPALSDAALTSPASSQSNLGQQLKSVEGAAVAVADEKAKLEVAQIATAAPVLHLAVPTATDKPKKSDKLDGPDAGVEVAAEVPVVDGPSAEKTSKGPASKGGKN